MVDGTIRQISELENVRLFVGDKHWTKYVITLKAKKLAGAEGFLVSFAATHPNSSTWWNIGGWNNTVHGLELRGSAGPQVRGSVESGRWYDIRIEVAGASVKCYLDNELIQETEVLSHPALYAAAGFNPSSQSIGTRSSQSVGHPGFYDYRLPGSTIVRFIGDHESANGCRGQCRELHRRTGESYTTRGRRFLL